MLSLIGIFVNTFLLKCDIALHSWFMLDVQRKAEAANEPTEGHTNIINLASGLMEKYWRPFHAAATKRIWAALYWLGSSLTEAHESIGGTWDSQCQHDSSQPTQCGFQWQCHVVKWVPPCHSCTVNHTDQTDRTCPPRQPTDVYHLWVASPSQRGVTG